MVDGASLLATMFAGMLAAGTWRETRGDNVLDSGAPWYDTYETRDGKPRRRRRDRAEVLRRPARAARARPRRRCRRSTTAAAGRLLRERFAERFRTRTRDEWCAAFDGTDACFAPVLSFTEVRARRPRAGARRHDRARRGDAAGAGAALLAHAWSGCPAAAGARRRWRATALADWGFDARTRSRAARGLGARAFSARGTDRRARAIPRSQSPGA